MPEVKLALEFKRYAKELLQSQGETIESWHKTLMHEDVMDMNTDELREEVYRLWTEGCRKWSPMEAWDRLEDMVSDELEAQGEGTLINGHNIAVALRALLLPAEEEGIDTVKFVVEVPKVEGVSDAELLNDIERSISVANASVYQIRKP